jgi:hypothetical protein
LYPDAIGGISDESLSFGWGVAKDEVWSARGWSGILDRLYGHILWQKDVKGIDLLKCEFHVYQIFQLSKIWL